VAFWSRLLLEGCLLKESGQGFLCAGEDAGDAPGVRGLVLCDAIFAMGNQFA